MALEYFIVYKHFILDIFHILWLFFGTFRICFSWIFCGIEIIIEYNISKEIQNTDMFSIDNANAFKPIHQYQTLQQTLFSSFSSYNIILEHYQ